VAETFFIKEKKKDHEENKIKLPNLNTMMRFGIFFIDAEDTME